MNRDRDIFLRDVKKSAERYCAYQERCDQEVRRKLLEKGISASIINEVIDHLIEHDFLNEERFAKAFVRGKFRIKKWGKYRLVQELKKRGISRKSIDLAITQISNDEYISAFNDLADKKNQSLFGNDKRQQRKKLVDYLLYRGWEQSLVYEKVKDLIPLH